MVASGFKVESYASHLSLKLCEGGEGFVWEESCILAGLVGFRVALGVESVFGLNRRPCCGFGLWLRALGGSKNDCCLRRTSYLL